MRHHDTQSYATQPRPSSVPSGHLLCESKAKCGTLAAAIEKASLDDFPKTQKRIRKVCSEVARSKEIIKSQANSPLEFVLNSLFPENDVAELTNPTKRIQFVHPKVANRKQL
jgi:hypothetical protein